MTRRNQRYRDLLRELNLTQIGAAKLLRVGDRTGQRWALGGAVVPWAHEKLLRLLAEGRITMDDLRD